jgi:hypothetical protein
MVCAWAYKDSYKQSIASFVGYSVFPFFSALALFALGIYAFIGYNTTTQIVGLGGLLVGIVFYRPSGYGTRVSDILAEE